MSANKIKSTSLIIDIILTVFLAIAIGIGIGITVKKPVTHTGELTTENYSKYIDVHCGLHNVTPAKDFTCNYRISVSPKADCTIYNLKITVEVISEYSDFGTYTLIAYEVTANDPCVQTGTVNYSLSGFPAISWAPNITVNVISVSGQFAYTSKR